MASPKTILRGGARGDGHCILFNAAGVLLLALMAVLAGGAALRESVTIDEVPHIGAGVSYLQKLDLRLNYEHPPLCKALAALPLVLRGAKVDYASPAWTAGKSFIGGFFGEFVLGELFLTKWNDPVKTLMWARLPMLMLTLALGWAIFAFGRRLGGAWGGLLCLVAFVSQPVILTFGPLVLTDLGVALFCVLATWTLADVYQEPTRKNVVWFALSLAGALLSKLSAPILFFVFLVFALSLRAWPLPGQPNLASPQAPVIGESPRAWRRRRFRALLRGIFWAACMVYAVYFILSVRQPTDGLYFLGSNPFALILRRLLMPPFAYLRGVAMLAFTFSRPTFLLGHAYTHGVWYFFPILFLLKSPLGFLGLLALALAVAWHRNWQKAEPAPAIPPQEAYHWRALWAGFVVFTGASLASRLTISYRHFTVPLAMLILLLAPLPRMALQLGSRTGRAVAAGLAALLAAACLFTAVHAYPNYFPYINALSFGRPTYELISDSNVDWNQALPEVRAFAERHGLAKLPVDSYALTDPRDTVPQAELWNCQRPAPDQAGEWVVLSANMIEDAHNCSWLMRYQHLALAGGSMYAVRLPAPIPPVGAPGGPPTASETREFLEFTPDLRSMFQDLVHHPEKLEPAVEGMRKQAAEAFKRFRQHP